MLILYLIFCITSIYSITPNSTSLNQNYNTTESSTTKACGVWGNYVLYSEPHFKGDECVGEIYNCACNTKFVETANWECGFNDRTMSAEWYPMDGDVENWCICFLTDIFCNGHRRCWPFTKAQFPNNFDIDGIGRQVSSMTLEPKNGECHWLNY